jgi:hypothetical protein
MSGLLMLAKVDYDAIAQSYDRRYRDNDYSGVEITLRSLVQVARRDGCSKSAAAPDIG